MILWHFILFLIWNGLGFWMSPGENGPWGLKTLTLFCFFLSGVCLSRVIMGLLNREPRAGGGDE